MQKSILFRTQKCKFIAKLSATRATDVACPWPGLSSRRLDPRLESLDQRMISWVKARVWWAKTWKIFLENASNMMSKWSDFRRIIIQIRSRRRFHRCDILISMKKRRNHFWQGFIFENFKRFWWSEKF